MSWDFAQHQFASHFTTNSQIPWCNSASPRRPAKIEALRALQSFFKERRTPTVEEDIRQGSKWCRLMNSETETADADIETPPLPTAAVGGHRGNFDAQLGLVLVPTLFGFLLSVAAGHGPASRTKRLNSAGFYNRPVISSWHTHNVVHAGEPFRKPCGCSALPTWEYSRWEPHRRFFHIHLFKVVSDCQVCVCRAAWKVAGVPRARTRGQIRRTGAPALPGHHRDKFLSSRPGLHSAAASRLERGGLCRRG